MKGAWTAWACALLPAGLGAMHLADAADGAHDAGVARALGLAAQPWGGLDAGLAGLLAALPVGTLTTRAAMGGALALGLAGAALFVLARRLLDACADAPRIGTAVAAIGTLCAVLAPAWQLEGPVAGGSALGAALALVPMALLAQADGEGEKPPWRLAVFVLGLAVSQDPLAGLTSLVACAALVATGRSARQRLLVAWWSEWRALVACAVGGLLPALLAMARTRAAGVGLVDALFAYGPAERGASASGAPWPYVQKELGVVMGALAVGGVVLSVLVTRARALAVGLVVATALGFACGWAGTPLGPARFGAPVLLATATACALAAASMQALVRAIAEARLPLAKASAVMVLVLELVAPVDVADDALRRADARAHGGGASPEAPAPAWDDAAWSPLPPRAIVLVTAPEIGRRAAAAQATGALRGDITVVPTYARGARVERVLAKDALLVPLWRDLALAGTPSEEALSALAAQRPLFAAFEPAWGKALGKHLVPATLFDRFEPEPRGTSDRKRALVGFTAKRERLARAILRDPDLTSAAAFLLRQRAVDVASSSDRDLVGAALADLDAFAPADPTGAMIVAKLLGRGPRP